MSKKRSQRNTKKYLKSLKAKRQKFYYGGYGGGSPINEVIVYADGGTGRPTYPQGLDGDLGDGGYFSGMGTGTGGYNPLGTTYGTPGGGTSSSSGSGSAGDGSGYGR